LPLFAVQTTHQANQLRLDDDGFTGRYTHNCTLQSLLRKSNKWRA
jgi:hypothetical protein